MQVGQPGVTFYDDPSGLIDVTANATATIINHELTVIPTAGFVGLFEIDVNVTNGYATAAERITVSVIETPNEAPVIQSIADQVMSHSADELRVPISASDADGDVLILAAEIAPSEEMLHLEINSLLYSANYQRLDVFTQ